MILNGVLVTTCVAAAPNENENEEENALFPIVKLATADGGGGEDAAFFLRDLHLVVRRVAHSDALGILAQLLAHKSKNSTSSSWCCRVDNTTLSVGGDDEQQQVLRVDFALQPLIIPHVLLRGVAPYCLEEDQPPPPEGPSVYSLEACFALTAQLRAPPPPPSSAPPSLSSSSSFSPLQPQLEDLPDALVMVIVPYLSPKDIKQLRACARRYNDCASQVPPTGLRTRLFPHQLRALNLMEQQETSAPRIDCAVQLLPNNQLNMDVFTGALSGGTHGEEEEEDQVHRSRRGGLFCDQPGLGKTCTMLALVLRTRGMLAHPQANQRADFAQQLGDKRKSPTRTARLESEARLNQLVGVKTTLVVAPGALLPHWESQIARHAPSLVVRTVDDSTPVARLPSSAADIAQLDVLLVSLNQVSRQHHQQDVSSSSSFLTSVLFLRCVVDEGHSLGGQGGGETNYAMLLKQLRSERYWIMTGTPAKMTNAGQSLRSLLAVLGFLRALPPAFTAHSGSSTSAADWIVRAFQRRHRPLAFHALASVLLRPILIRHTKEEIAAHLPVLERTSTTLELNAAEKRQYNLLAGFIRANLVLTALGDSNRGWDQSLLNPAHRARCLELIEQLRATCTAGASEAFRLLLREKNRVETLALFAHESEDARTAVASFLERTTVNNAMTRCGRCGGEYDFVLVSRCGHFTCPDCFEEQEEEGEDKMACGECGCDIDVDDFAFIQPGFDLDRFLNVAAEATGATKADYLIRRIEQAREEERGAGVPPPKFIVFSQFPLVRNYLGDALIRHFGGDSVAEFWGKYRQVELDKFTRGRVEAWRCNACHRLNSDMVSKTCGQDVARVDLAPNVVLQPELAIENWTSAAQHQRPAVGDLVRFVDNARPAARLVAVKPCRGRRATAAEADVRAVRCDILLLGKDGSVGLDVSSATHVFLAEYVWDAALEEQMVSRAWRLGNRARTVRVEQLVMKDTVEDILRGMGGGGGGKGGEHEGEDPRIKAVLQQIRLLK